jgi:hypothetical protein
MNFQDCRGFAPPSPESFRIKTLSKFCDILSRVGKFILRKVTEMYGETIWVKGLRVITWIMLVIGVVGGLSSAWSAARTVDAWTGESEFAFLTFFLILAVSLISTFIVAALIMVLLDIASDVAASRQAHYEMLRIMQRGDTTESPTSKTLTGDFWQCAECDEKTPASSRTCKGCGKYR